MDGPKIVKWMAASSIMAAAFSASAQDRPDLSTPPALAPEVLRAGDCEVDIASARSKYPMLFDFLDETAFQGSETVFQNKKEALDYYFSESRLQMSQVRSAIERAGGDASKANKSSIAKDANLIRAELREQRKKLRTETREFGREYAGPCRRLAWAALGARVTEEEGIAQTLSAVDAAGPAEIE